MSAITVTDSDLPTPPTSLSAKLLNIFVRPSEVFDEVLAAPRQSATWRVPTLLICFTGIIYRMATAKEQLVSAASVPLAGSARLSADQVYALASAQPLLSALAICVSVFAGVFWCALVLWFVGRVFLRTRFDFGKALEVVGLSSIILVLGSVVTLLLIAACGDVAARPALSFFLGKTSPRAHAIFDALNFFHLWSVSVLAIGLSRLSGVSVKESAFWVFGYWMFTRIALILLG